MVTFSPSTMTGTCRLLLLYESILFMPSESLVTSMYVNGVLFFSRCRLASVV